MERRLIDANALRQDWLENGENEYVYDTNSFLDSIDEAPTIDAVEVCRCRDCKQAMLWRKPTDKVIGECFIRKMHSDDEQFCVVGEDDFCSWGERREDGKKLL